MQAPRRPRALISGAGVAGPALAYWLLRAGIAPTLIESAPAPRQGGYIIDFWGLGFEVAERMGLAERIRRRGYWIDEIRLVGAAGETNARLPVGDFVRGLGDRYISLLRSDLASELYDAVRDRIEIRFDEEVLRLEQKRGVVEVSFRRGPPGEFDYVFGADGLHSSIRRLIFPEARATPLGFHVAAFTARDYPHRDERAYVSRTTPGRQVARYSLRAGDTTIFMVMRSELARGRTLTSADEQRAYLAQTYANVGWEASSLQAAIERADDLYFDTVSQVRLPNWSRGHVALVGDAAYCPSLLAGEGASFGMAGAMVLAGELAAAMGGPRQAFHRYEQRLRGFIETKQRGALRLGAWFAPRTQFGVTIRDAITRLAALPGLSRLVSGSMFDDHLELPRYDWSE